MNDDQLKEDVTKLMAVIIKDRFLREKLNIDLLESIAESNDLLLSDNLIQFASEVRELAYKQAQKDEILDLLAKYIEEATK